MSISEYLNASLPEELRIDDLQQVGIAGFYADAKINQGDEKTQAVPNIPLEDGSFLNDHIIKEPTVITIEGSVTNVRATAAAVPDLPLRIPVPLGVNSFYKSNLTEFQQLVEIPQTIVEQNTSNLYGVAPSGLDIPTQFIDHMSRIYDAGIVIDIETPFSVLTNMALLSFSTTRTNEDDSVRYTLRAQQLEFVKIKTTSIDQLKKNPNGSGYTDTQDKGDQQGQGATSLLGKIFPGAL